MIVRSGPYRTPDAPGRFQAGWARRRPPSFPESLRVGPGAAESGAAAPNRWAGPGPASPPAARATRASHVAQNPIRASPGAPACQSVAAVALGRRLPLSPTSARLRHRASIADGADRPPGACRVPAAGEVGPRPPNLPDTYPARSMGQLRGPIERPPRHRTAPTQPVSGDGAAVVKSHSVAWPATPSNADSTNMPR